MRQLTWTSMSTVSKLIRRYIHMAKMMCFQVYCMCISHPSQRTYITAVLYAWPIILAGCQSYVYFMQTPLEHSTSNHPTRRGHPLSQISPEPPPRPQWLARMTGKRPSSADNSGYHSQQRRYSVRVIPAVSYYSVCLCLAVDPLCDCI